MKKHKRILKDNIKRGKERKLNQKSTYYVTKWIKIWKKKKNLEEDIYVRTRHYICITL